MMMLLDNPIADIHGPAFLLVYGVIAIAVILMARAIVRSRDRTDLRPLPPVPDTFDACEIAFLRGGANAVIRTVLYALYQRGLAQAVPVASSRSARPAEVVASPDLRDTGALTELERRVLRAIAAPVNPARLFQDRALRGDVEVLCQPYVRKLEAEGLLRTADDKGAAMKVPFTAGAILVALTVYKIAVANGRPVGFLIALTIVALIFVWTAVGSAAKARISKRGRAFLERLQAAYRGAVRPAARGADPQPDMVPVAMVGLFGMGILSATPDAAFANMFAASTAGGGSCGGGCGGGGCGGGGCGGGCGG